MRKLATVRVIDDIQPIKNADAIEVATVGGWKAVIGKGTVRSRRNCYLL
jgi:predicted amino acid dehydrogenase